ERTTENSIFTAELGQASLQIEKALDRKRTRTVRARYSFQRTVLSNIAIPQLVLPEDQKVRLSTVSAEYIRDTRDNALDAHRGVVFYDGGNVYSNINFHQFVDRYSNSLGFGIRYRTPVGPIRIDIGRNLNPVPGVKATQYFVTLGQAF